MKLNRILLIGLLLVLAAAITYSDDASYNWVRPLADGTINITGDNSSWNQELASTLFVNKSGDTMTGNLKIRKSIPILTVEAPDDSGAQVRLKNTEGDWSYYVAGSGDYFLWNSLTSHISFTVDKTTELATYNYGISTPNITSSKYCNATECFTITQFMNHSGQSDTISNVAGDTYAEVGEDWFNLTMAGDKILVVTNPFIPYWNFTGGVLQDIYQLSVNSQFDVGDTTITTNGISNSNPTGLSVGGQYGLSLNFNGANFLESTSANLVKSKQANWEWYYDNVRNMYWNTSEHSLNINTVENEPYNLYVNGSTVLTDIAVLDYQQATTRGINWYPNDSNSNYAEIGGGVQIGVVNTASIIRAVDGVNDYLNLQGSGAGGVWLNYNSGTAATRVYDGGTTNYVEVDSPVTTHYYSGATNNGIKIQNAYAGSADAYVQWVAGAGTFTMGVDDSQSGDPWTLAASSALGSSNVITATSSLVTISPATNVGGLLTASADLQLSKSTFYSSYTDFDKDSTHPDVSKGTHFLTNCPATCSINNFINPDDGQSIHIIGNDGARTTILDRTASGSSIYINGAADVTLADGEMMICDYNQVTAKWSCVV